MAIRETRSGVLLDYILITLCCVGTALVIHLFQLPNHFVFGGVTGMAILLSTVTGISFSLLNILINLILLILAFLCLGRSFGVRTVYVTVCTALCFEVLEQALPIPSPLTGEPALEVLIVTFSIAAMGAELFQLGACSGGTDGARLSFAGIPCPNLGIGGWAYHSPKEHITVEIMDQVSRVLEEVIYQFNA